MDYGNFNMDFMRRAEKVTRLNFMPADVTTLDYKILAVWPKRSSDVQTAKQFEDYLVNKLKMYNHPLTVSN